MWWCIGGGGGTIQPFISDKYRTKLLYPNERVFCARLNYPPPLYNAPTPPQPIYKTVIDQTQRSA